MSCPPNNGWKLKLQCFHMAFVIHVNIMWITLAQFKYVHTQIKSITFFLCEYTLYYWHAWYIFIMVVTWIFIILMEKCCLNEKTSHCKLMNVNWLAHQSLSFIQFQIFNWGMNLLEWIYLVIASNYRWLKLNWTFSGTSISLTMNHEWSMTHSIKQNFVTNGIGFCYLHV
jgi:hypothetical protein